MNEYYINKIPNSNGFYILHMKGCFRCFLAAHTIFFGSFETCQQAVKKAQQQFGKVVPCNFCLPNCFPQKDEHYKPNKQLFE